MGVWASGLPATWENAHAESLQFDIFETRRQTRDANNRMSAPEDNLLKPHVVYTYQFVLLVKSQRIFFAPISSAATPFYYK